MRKTRLYFTAAYFVCLFIFNPAAWAVGREVAQNCTVTGGYLKGSTGRLIGNVGDTSVVVVIAPNGGVMDGKAAPYLAGGHMVVSGCNVTVGANGPGRDLKVIGQKPGQKVAGLEPLPSDDNPPGEAWHSGQQQDSNHGGEGSTTR